MIPPAPAAMLKASLALAKELSLDLSEETIGGRFLQTLEELLPGRALCLRVVEGQRHELTSLFSVGPEVLVEARGGPLRIKRAALRHTGLPAEIATSARIRLTDRYVPLFSGTTGGFSVPLVAGGELLGVLNCEYPPPREGSATPGRAQDLPRKDEAAIIPLCNQLSVALRNLRLLHRAHSYEGYLRRMIDAGSALVAVVGRDQRLTIVNRPMEQLTGYAPGDDLGALLRRAPDQPGHLDQAGLPGAQPHLATLLQRALLGQDSDGVEVQLCRQGGPPARAVFNVTALRDATGAIDGAAAMGQDLERVRSLERQVLQAERLATLGQLAAGVVHELNNPLSSIVSYGDYLARRLDGAGADFRADAERARRICESAERIQKLTRDLMSYGRPTTGELERLDLGEVVTQALSFCDHLLQKAGARVRTAHAEGLPKVLGVRTQLQQVVVNLLTNACHATTGISGKPEDKIRISTTAATLNGAPAVLLTVADSGSGIPEAHRARVFEPFFSTKVEGQGTGLGLPIVKNIVDAHGGQVSFETTVGLGTCFLVLLPAAGP